MSNNRYDWWSYVRAMIRSYPQKVRELSELHRQNVTAAYSGMPGGGGAKRTTEIIAVRELPTNAQREYEAVFRAIETVKLLPDGNERLKLVDLLYWKNTHTIAGAAREVNVSKRTAERMNSHFIKLVAAYYGFFD